MAGNLLTRRQDRTVRLDGLDRFGLAGEGTVLRDQRLSTEDNRKGEKSTESIETVNSRPIRIFDFLHAGFWNDLYAGWAKVGSS